MTSIERIEVCLDNYLSPNFVSDVDECTNGQHKCHKEALCANTHGSYQCSCNLGFIGNGTVCKGICSALNIL